VPFQFLSGASWPRNACDGASAGRCKTKSNWRHPAQCWREMPTSQNPFDARSGRLNFPQFEDVFQRSPSIDTIARLRPVHMSPLASPRHEARPSPVSANLGSATKACQAACPTAHCTFDPGWRAMPQCSPARRSVAKQLDFSSTAAVNAQRPTWMQVAAAAGWPVEAVSGGSCRGAGARGSFAHSEGIRRRQAFSPPDDLNTCSMHARPSSEPSAGESRSSSALNLPSPDRWVSGARSRECVHDPRGDARTNGALDAYGACHSVAEGANGGSTEPHSEGASSRAHSSYPMRAEQAPCQQSETPDGGCSAAEASGGPSAAGQTCDVIHSAMRVHSPNGHYSSVPQEEDCSHPTLGSALPVPASTAGPEAAEVHGAATRLPAVDGASLPASGAACGRLSHAQPFEVIPQQRAHTPSPVDATTETQSRSPAAAQPHHASAPGGIQTSMQRDMPHGSAHLLHAAASAAAATSAALVAATSAAAAAESAIAAAAAAEQRHAAAAPAAAALASIASSATLGPELRPEKEPPAARVQEEPSSFPPAFAPAFPPAAPPNDCPPAAALDDPASFTTPPRPQPRPRPDSATRPQPRPRPDSAACSQPLHWGSSHRADSWRSPAQRSNSPGSLPARRPPTVWPASTRPRTDAPPARTSAAWASSHCPHAMDRSAASYPHACSRPASSSPPAIDPLASSYHRPVDRPATYYPSSSGRPVEALPLGPGVAEMHMLRCSVRSQWASHRLRAMGGPLRPSRGYADVQASGVGWPLRSHADAEMSGLGWGAAGSDAWAAEHAGVPSNWRASAPVLSASGVPTAMPFAVPRADRAPNASAAEASATAAGAAAAARIAQPWIDRLILPAAPAAAPAWLEAQMGASGSPAAWTPGWGLAVLPLMLPATPLPPPLHADRAVESAWALSHMGWLGLSL
jgi:hypothetical protein